MGALRQAAAAAPILALLAMAPALRADDAPRYDLAITDINHVGLTVTNYGFFGNGFLSRAPSFEFPLGSGYEHMSRAGLWVGAIAIADSFVFTGVSTGIVDAAQGSGGQSDTEFTPADAGIVALSRIQNSRYYSPDALSDLDLVCHYRDRPSHARSGNQREDHVALGVRVNQRTLGFSLEAADAFIVVQFTVVNENQNPLRDVYLGLYAQLVSGDKKAYPTWPPSSASGTAGSWYYKTHAEFDPDLRMYKERFCQQSPYPDNCNFAYCPPWAAVKLLAVHPDTIADKRISFGFWSYNPPDTSRDTDRKRYRIMSNGLIADPSECVPGGSCSPIGVISVGPFAELDPGDSLQLDVAFLGGEDDERLLHHAEFAQFASDIHYRLPAPPPSPRLRVETGERRVDFYWDDSPETVRDPTSPAPDQMDFEGYRLYLGLDRAHPLRIAQYDRPDTAGFNTGLEVVRLPAPYVVDGVSYRYHYAAEGLRDGFNYYGGITSYDIGDEKIPSLESGLSQNKFQAVPLPAPHEGARGVTVFPNPYRVEARWDQGRQVRDHYLWFANLPRRCILRIFTLAGDRVFETRFDGSTYRGESARGLYDPVQDLDTPPPVLSGASYAWNLISERGGAISTGLYLFSVEDLETGQTSRGKFLVVKSDREN